MISGSGSYYSRGPSCGLGSSSETKDKSWINKQASIVGSNSVIINTVGNTDINGGLIANIDGNGVDGGNLSISTGSLSYRDIEEQDHYWRENNSFGVSNLAFGRRDNNVPAGSSGQAGNYYPRGSLSIGESNEGYEKERITRATLGNGSITIGGDSISDDSVLITGLNRDIDKSQEVTKDIKTGGASYSLDVDLRLLSEEGRAEIVAEAKEAIEGGKAAIEATANKYDDILIEGPIDAFKRITHSDEMSTAFINNDQEQLAIYKEKHDLSDAEVKLVQQHYAGEITPKEFKDGLDETSRNSLIVDVLVGFDGTNNNNLDRKNKDKETNIARIDEIYNTHSDNKAYIIGVGTDGILDKPCLIFGCGGKKRVRGGVNYISDIARNNPDKILLIDTSGFSRGGAIARDFVNRINRRGIQGVSPESFDTRSLMLFDTVGSFGKAGNDINLSYDLSTTSNPDMMVFHAISEGEKRKNFPLSSISFSDGTLPANHIEQSFPGVHSDIGGSYFDKKDMSYLTLEWMVNQANDAGVPLQDIPNKYKPSAQFMTDYNNYQKAKARFNNNPTPINKALFDSKSKVMEDNYTHKSDTNGTLKFWNWSKKKRNVYYPNGDNPDVISNNNNQ